MLTYRLAALIERKRGSVVVLPEVHPALTDETAYLKALRQTRWPRWNMPITGDHQARQRCVLRPKRLQRLRHGTASLASAQHKGAALGGLWQLRAHAVQGLGAAHRGIKKGP